MKLNADFRELLSAFNDAGVKYLLVDAWAMSIHGMPRYTGDIDLFYEPTLSNTQRIIQALSDFGFHTSELTEQTLLEPDSVFYFGRPPFRIDLLNFLSGTTFAAAWQTRLQLDIDGINVHLISLEQLAQNKRATGRLKDLADLEIINKRLQSDG